MTLCLLKFQHRHKMLHTTSKPFRKPQTSFWRVVMNPMLHVVSMDADSPLGLGPPLPVSLAAKCQRSTFRNPK